MGNWAYSLHLGIKDYSYYATKVLNWSEERKNNLNLYRTVNDAETFRENLGNINNYYAYCDYWSRELLTDREATLKNFLVGLIYILNNVKSGDLVVISFSGHGSYSNKKNYWLLFDANLYDHELYQLMRLFPKDVRVVLISDSCESRGIIDIYPENTDLKSNQKLIERMAEIDEDFSNRLKYLLKFTDGKSMECDLVHISATASDSTSVNDCLSFIQYVNEFFKEKGFNYNETLYELYKYVREKAQYKFEGSSKLFRILAFNMATNLPDSDYLPFDPSSKRDEIGMIKILPHFNLFGKISKKQFDKAFNV